MRTDTYCEIIASFFQTFFFLFFSSKVDTLEETKEELENAQEKLKHVKEKASQREGERIQRQRERERQL